MFGNYFKIALRNMLRHMQYSVINILGLALGIASCIVILLLVRNELSFDRFHGKADRIYRLCEKMSNKGWMSNMISTQGPAGPAMTADFPEVVNYVRFQPAAWRGGYLVKNKDKGIVVQNACFADPSIFEVFDFKLVSGDSKTALAEPFTAVLTEETARKIFGDDNPLGKFFANERQTEYKVTGIMENVPPNSHLQFDILLSTKEMTSQPEHQINSWGVFNFATYVLLEKGADVKSLEEKLPGFVRKYFQEDAGIYEFHLQPLRDIHLRSTHLDADFLNWHKGDITHVYLYSVLAFIILLIACFNFMNLATARSAGRAREVGVDRKSVV
jgi:putative ABC transport system permease protein